MFLLFYPSAHTACYFYFVFSRDTSGCAEHRPQEQGNPRFGSSLDDFENVHHKVYTQKFISGFVVLLQALLIVQSLRRCLWPWIPL